MLLRKLKLSLKPSPSVATDEAHFILTSGFRAYLRMSQDTKELDMSLKPLLRAAAPRFCRLPGFLESLLAYENELIRRRHESNQSSSERESPDTEEDPFIKALVGNLSTNSHELRLVSLRILNQLSPAAHDSSSTLAIMLQAEETPLDLQNLRTISLYLRKLGKIYASVDQSSWLRKAVPAFLMGMMTVRLTPVWDDAVEALKDIAETKDGEDIIAAITFGWLDIPSQRWSGPPRPMLQPTSRRLTDFECSNLSHLQEKSEEMKNIVDELFEVMLRAFEDAQTTVPDVTETARSKALKVFTAIPSIAERRSRKLVPHLFSWNDVDQAHGDDSDDNAQHKAEGKSWSLVDRKALIEVFSLFQNPRVLYQNQQVFDVLLNLVANGDIEVQKLALKAILAWKQEGVKRYQENLQGLLEEARLRNELTMLFQGDNKIRDADRPELMPVLLRLLYGRTISKMGAASGRAGVQGTRHAVIRSLSVQDVGGFLEIALGPIHGLRVVDSTGLCNKVFDQHNIPARKQVGLLNMLETIITELGSSVLEYMDPLVNSVLYCLIPACRRLQADRERKLRTSSDEAEDDDEEEDGDGDGESEASLLRAARTTALKCLCALLKHAAGFDWTPYQGPIVSEVVSPQIATLAQETTQGVSWTLRLLETWSLMPRCALALSIDAGVIPAVIQCITVPHTKAEVKIFALGIVRNLIRLSLAPTEESEFNELIRAEILDPNLDLVLGEIGRLLIVDKSKTSDEKSPEKATAAAKPTTAVAPPVGEGDEDDAVADEPVNEEETAEEEAADGEVVLQLAPIGRQLLEAAVDTVVEIAPLVENSKNTRNLVEISTFLLNQPARFVNPKVKGAILLILERFVVLESLQDDAKLRRDLYETICSLFSFFKDRQNRQSLSRLLLVFATQEPAILEVADLSSELNSFVEGRLDEPDYDRRLAAFRAICKPRDVPFTIEQWLPLLHNFICYMHHDEEHAILSQNSADGICQFIEAAASVWDQLLLRKQFADRLDRILLPAIYAGAREKSETVRREFLRVLGFLASHLRSWEPVADLAPLVPEAEEGDEAMEETQQSKKKRDLDFFYNILTPAVSKQVQALQFLQGVNERSSLGSRNVSKFFIPLLEHFILGREDGSDDQGLGAQATNTISSLAGALEWPQYRALLRRYVLYVKSKPELHKQIIRLLDKVVEALEVAAGQAYKMESTDGSKAVAYPSTSALGKRLPSREKFSDEVSGPLMATLLEHLHEKDETTVSSRVPIGVIIVKLLNLLPANVRDLKLPGVLTDICHILRSKGWDSREMARSTLVKIACILGAPCFGFILKELRGALTRGYQLHVLSYTVHSILVAVIPEFKQGDLDYCVDQVVAVIMDDIFGVTGQEKEAEEYTNKMKEIKSSKSQDSMELIAKNTSISCLITLVQPLKDLLLEKLNLRMARKIDELLSRVTAGLLHNPAAESKDALIFCYEVIQEVYNSKKPEAEVKLDPRLKRYLIQKGAKKNDRGTTTKHTYKLIRFSLDVLRSLMRKHDSLRTASYASGFLPILGDAVIAGEEEVKVAAFKLLVVLVKVPFKDNDSINLYKVALKEALRTISGSTTTTSEVAQSALRLVSVILRDRSDVPVKDAAIDMLLGRVKDDLTEPLHRHITFSFLRSVLDRKLETAVVYDTLDHVGTVMITNDDKDTRDLARGAFFQFLREYPQKKARWAKQLKFIVANLQYDREGGRLSVMEVLHLLLMKSADDFVQEVCTTCFIPLVFVLANDDSDKCKLAAAELVKEVLRRADKASTQNFLTILRGWLGQDENAGVLRLGIQTLGFYFEVREASGRDKKDFALLKSKILDIVSDAAGQDAGLVNVCLAVVRGALDRDPARVLGPDSRELWDRIVACLSHADAAVKLSAVKLLSSYLADFARGGGLRGSHGLELDQAGVMRLIRLNLGVLGSDEVTEPLAEEVAQILVFLGNAVEFESEESESESDDEGDNGSDDDNDGEAVERDDGKKFTNSRYIFGRLAAIIRKETRPRSAELVPKLAALDVLSAYCGSLAPVRCVRPSLRAILRPLRNVTDPAVPTPWSPDADFAARHESLRAKARDCMEALQRRLGTAAYTAALLAVGEGVRGRREMRSTKRKIEAVAAPERAGAEKRKRFEKKKEKRKARGREHRAMRQAV